MSTFTKIAVICCAGLALAACQNDASEQTHTTQSSQPLAQKTVYQGTLPCADCAGIKNTLTLYRDSNNTPTRYKLVEQYLEGKGNLTIIYHGDWQLHADAADKSEGLNQRVVLSKSDPKSKRIFLHDADNTLELLGEDGKPADSGLNYELVKQ